MQITSQDRNTGITIAVVLIVCTASLIAIGASFIRLISPSINTLGNALGARVRVVTMDYNFAIPGSITAQNSTPSTPTAQFVQGNFDVPGPRPLPASWQASIGKDFGLAAEVKRQGYGLIDEGDNQINFQLIIPTAGLTTPVFQGNDGIGNLTKGAWIHPGSQGFRQGETIILCERSMFGPEDERSCLYLDDVKIDDEIIVKTEDTEYKYKVIGKNVFPHKDSSIYQTTSEATSLKMITTHPVGDNHHLVILAVPVTD